MSQNFPAHSGHGTRHFQRFQLPVSICSRSPNRYLVVIFSSILLTAPQSASGRSGLADNFRNNHIFATRAPERTRSPTSEPACNPGCVTVIDYQSTSTHLTFSRSYYNADLTRDELPARWQHRFEIRLTRQGDDRIVFDHHGIRHLFRLHPDGTYSAADEFSGDLLEQEGQYLWTDRHAIQYQFYGSFPMSLHFPDNQILTLQYRLGQLQSITDDESMKIELVHENGFLTEVLLPDGRSLRHTGDPCNPLLQPTTEEPPDRCDTEQNPAPGFQAIESRPGMSTLDARPASCQSYFVEFYGTVRGEEIEAGLEEHPPYAGMIATNRSFPIIDFINGDELIVVRSRDIGSPTYNNPDSSDNLYERLMRDGEQIQRRALDPLESEGVLSGTENGRTTLITYGEQQSVALHLLIRQDMASAGHWQQIENARTALASRYGIRLQVVIIP